MKTLAIFLCSLCFVSYTVVRAQHPDTPTTCLTKVGVTLDELPTLMTDDSDAGRRRRDCLTACYMQQAGWMTENIMNLDRILTDVETAIIDYDRRMTLAERVRDCILRSLSLDPCETARKFATCAFDALRIDIRRALQGIIPHM